MMVHLRALTILAAASLTGACATLPERAPATAELQARAEVPGFPAVRFDFDAPVATLERWRNDLLRDRANAAVSHPLNLLAISSGSDDGAFGAGYLVGWTGAGTRPDFDIVIGVSTGAMIAPFAFVGSAKDPTLSRLYTGIGADDIFRLRPVSGVLGGPALASSRPLRELIEREITPALLREIAEAHTAGRRLLVLTTNLDTQRGTIWDIGAIAQQDTHEAERLVERVLLASASIPVLLPPVLIEVTADGETFTEMHVDGGTTASILAVPQALLWNEDVGDRREVTEGGSLTVLYNGFTQPRYEIVEPRTFPVLNRSLQTMIAAADRRMLRSYRGFAERNGMTFSILAIEEDFDDEEFLDRERFDRAYMNALFQYARRRAIERGR
ncbi:patatin-like phospholipase family protein [Tritonibacter scottomollicae]|uniref:patatin-like phospholipase family protein n=1 Tax=Tritonibacter scottomollicae TaxID=483013 RepID=UPI003AA9BBC3